MKRLLLKDVRRESQSLKQSRKKRMRMQALFLARLVSLASLDALPEGERARLITDARRAGFPCGESVDRLLWAILVE